MASASAKQANRYGFFISKITVYSSFGAVNGNQNYVNKSFHLMIDNVKNLDIYHFHRSLGRIRVATSLSYEQRYRPNLSNSSDFAALRFAIFR